MVGSGVEEPLVALVHVRLGQYAASVLPLPGAMASLTVRDSDVEMNDEVGPNGPLPLPLEVAVPRTVPEEVELTL